MNTTEMIFMTGVPAVLETIAKELKTANELKALEMKLKYDACSMVDAVMCNEQQSYTHSN